MCLWYNVIMLVSKKARQKDRKASRKPCIKKIERQVASRKPQAASRKPCLKRQKARKQEIIEYNRI